MQHYRWRWIVLLDLLPGLCLLFAQSSASAKTIHHGLADSAGTLDRQQEADWAEREPVIRALTAEEARHLGPLRSNSGRPTVRPEQKAILPSPRNSGELVDRLMAQEAQEMRQFAIAMGTAEGTKHQVLGHSQRLAHSWPFPHGG